MMVIVNHIYETSFMKENDIVHISGIRIIQLLTCELEIFIE